jgi:hypothetical protein
MFMLRTEMKAAITSKWAYIAAAILCYLILPNAIKFYIYPGYDTSAIDHLTFIIEPMAFTALAPFAALFCILPYSMSFCDEYNSSFTKNILLRTTTGRYAFSKILSIGFSGGLTIALVFSIVFVIAVIRGGPVTQDTLPGFYDMSIWRDMALNSGGYMVLLWKLVLGFLFGIVWALLGLLMSCLFMNRFISILVSFCIYQSLWMVLSGRWYNPVYLLRGDGYLIPSLGHVVGAQLAIIMFAALISFIGVTRRCRNV